jgi:hypothetical protein
VTDANGNQLRQSYIRLYNTNITYSPEFFATPFVKYTLYGFQFGQWVVPFAGLFINNILLSKFSYS